LVRERFFINSDRYIKINYVKKRMLESLINPKRAERRPWEMFFIGLLYASVSLLVVSFVFGKDNILRDYGGIFVLLFIVLCTLPFMYYLIKLEEEKDIQISNEGKLIKEHSKALWSLMFLFAGILVGLSLLYIILPSHTAVNFNAQIKVFCAINSPANFDYCIERQGISPVTGSATRPELIMNIFANNIYVLIFTLLFSLAFGAGAIFVLAWNASVIAVAIGIFFKDNFYGGFHIAGFFLSFFRYMLHGGLEIASYFIAALAGGVISVAIIRKDLRGERLWKILQDSLILIIIAIVILIIATLLEVFVTPTLF